MTIESSGFDTGGSVTWALLQALRQAATPSSSTNGSTGTTRLGTTPSGTKPPTAGPPSGSAPPPPPPPPPPSAASGVSKLADDLKSLLLALCSLLPLHLGLSAPLHLVNVEVAVDCPDQEPVSPVCWGPEVVLHL